jgi:hypothetical protein
MASLVEINFVKAPVVAGEVHGTAPDALAVLNGRRQHGLFAFVLAEGVGLKVVIVGEDFLSDIGLVPIVARAKLVVFEVGVVEVRTLLKHDYLEAGNG